MDRTVHDSALPGHTQFTQLSDTVAYSRARPGATLAHQLRGDESGDQLRDAAQALSSGCWPVTGSTGRTSPCLGSRHQLVRTRASPGAVPRDTGSIDPRTPACAG